MEVLIRAAASDREILWQTIFSRYPAEEWGTFIQLGWRHTPQGLILTLRGIDPPRSGDLDPSTWITRITSQYTRRIIREVQTHDYAIGFVHSHPEGYDTQPSESDYDMEAYYSKLLGGYAPNRPFVSLIFSEFKGKTSASGRVWYQDQWHRVTKFCIEGVELTDSNLTLLKKLPSDIKKRMARFASVYSEEAAELLFNSTVAVIGASGTGSPVVELLARANIGKIIVVDPKPFEDSNFERNHASTLEDVGKLEPKVLISKRYVRSLNGTCEIVAIQGSLPQDLVLDHVLWADIVVGCTDLHSARASLTDIVTRYLVPVIDVGVKMEGNNGKLDAQVIQVNRIFPDDACFYCRGSINSRVATQELMNQKERDGLQNEARKATAKGREPDAYWVDVPQLNTVGYLTTTAGGMIAGYVIGYLTRRFEMPKNRVELSFSRIGTTIVERHQLKRPDCVCQTGTGSCDQDPLLIRSACPSHWPKPLIL